MCHVQRVSLIGPQAATGTAVRKLRVRPAALSMPSRQLRAQNQGDIRRLWALVLFQIRPDRLVPSLA